MFLLNKSKYMGKYKTCIISNTNFQIEICYEHGLSIIQSNNLLLNKADDDKIFTNCFLAPFPNRVESGTYIFEGKEYSLERNEDNQNALHGLVFNRKFTITKVVETKLNTNITFETIIKENEFVGYPFCLKMEINFKLTLNKLKISVFATNVGSNNLPYGIGWHPYFIFDKKINNCFLDIPAGEVLTCKADKPQIPNGQVVTNDYKSGKIGKRELDTCFTNLNGKPFRIEDIQIFYSTNIDFLQIYTPKDRKSIAIEPMSCAPNSFNNHIGLITLLPKQKVSHFFGIKKLL